MVSGLAPSAAGWLLVLTLLVAVLPAAPAAAQSDVDCPQTSNVRGSTWSQQSSVRASVEDGIYKKTCEYKAGTSQFGQILSSGTGETLKSGGNVPSSYGFVDDDGNEKIDREEPVFLMPSTGSSGVPGGSLRLAYPIDGSLGTQVRASHQDFGLSVTVKAFSLRYMDWNSNDELDTEDTVFVDNDHDSKVSLRDLILSGDNAGTLVTSDHHMFNRGLTDYPGTVKYVDVDKSGDYNDGDTVFLDADKDSKVSSPDVRLSSETNPARVRYTLQWETDDQATGELRCGSDIGPDEARSTTHHALVAYETVDEDRRLPPGASTFATTLVGLLEDVALECVGDGAAGPTECPAWFDRTDGSSWRLASGGSPPSGEVRDVGANVSELTCRYQPPSDEEGDTWTLTIEWIDQAGPEPYEACTKAGQAGGTHAYAETAHAQAEWTSHGDAEAARSFAQDRLEAISEVAAPCVDSRACPPAWSFASTTVPLRRSPPVYEAVDDGMAVRELACQYGDPGDDGTPHQQIYVRWATSDPETYWPCKEPGAERAGEIASETHPVAVAWTNTDEAVHEETLDLSERLMPIGESRASTCPSSAPPEEAPPPPPSETDATGGDDNATDQDPDGAPGPGLLGALIAVLAAALVAHRREG